MLFKEMMIINILVVKLRHEYFRKNKCKAINTTLDNCVTMVNIQNDILKITLKGRKGQKKMRMIAFDIMSILFLALGGMPKIEEMSYNSCENNLTDLAGKFNTDEYFRESILCICPISSALICQGTLDAYRTIMQIPIYSMQYLVSENYKHIITNHRIVLLLHVIDGFIDDGVISKCKLEIANKYNPSDNPGNYMCKVFFLCKNYFYKYHRKYNCKILQLLKVNQYEFLQIISDTRNWYSHFFKENKKIHRLTDGAEMRIYFEIVFYLLRVYLMIEKLHISVDESVVQEYFYIIHDWILDVRKSDQKLYKSKTYKINEGLIEMEQAMKQLNVECSR